MRFERLVVAWLVALSVSACGGGGGGGGAAPGGSSPPPPPASPPPPPPPPPPSGPFSSANQQSLQADDSYWEVQRNDTLGLLIGWSRFVDPYDDGIRENRLRVFSRTAGAYEFTTEINTDALDSFLTSPLLPVIYEISGLATLRAHVIDIATGTHSVAQSIDLDSLLGWDVVNMPEQPMLVSPDGTLFYLVRGSDVASFLVDTVTGELTYQGTYAASSLALPPGTDPTILHAELTGDGSRLVATSYHGSAVLLQTSADGALSVARDVVLDGFVPGNWTLGYSSLGSFELMQNGDQLVAVADGSSGSSTDTRLLSWTWDGSGYLLADELHLPDFPETLPSLAASPAGDLLLLGFRWAPQLDSIYRGIQNVAVTTAVDAAGSLASAVPKACPSQNAFSSYRRGLYDPGTDSFLAAGPNLSRFEYTAGSGDECLSVHLPPGETTIPDVIQHVSTNADASLMVALSASPQLSLYRRESGTFEERQSVDLTSLVAPRKIHSVQFSPDGRHLYAYGNLNILVFEVTDDQRLVHVESVNDPDDRGIGGLMYFSQDGLTVFTVAKRLDQYIDRSEITPVVNAYSRDAVSGHLALQQSVLLDASVVYSITTDQFVSAAMSPDERHLYVGVQTSQQGNMGILYVMDVEQPASMQLLEALIDQGMVPGTPLSDDVLDGLRQVSGIAVSPDGSRVIMTGRYYGGLHPSTLISSDTAIIEFDRDAATGDLSLRRYRKNNDNEAAGEPADMAGGYFHPTFSRDGEYLILLRARYIGERQPSHGIDVYQWSGEAYDFIEHVSSGGFGPGLVYISGASGSDTLAGINWLDKSIEIADFAD